MGSGGVRVGAGRPSKLNPLQRMELLGFYLSRTRALANETHASQIQQRFAKDEIDENLKDFGDLHTLSDLPNGRSAINVAMGILYDDEPEISCQECEEATCSCEQINEAVKGMRCRISVLDKKNRYYSGGEKRGHKKQIIQETIAHAKNQYDVELKASYITDLVKCSRDDILDQALIYNP